MGELLSQALNLTLVGMGMTFAAIGVLVAGMYALTTFLADEEEAEEAPEIPEVAEAPADQAALQLDVGRYHARYRAAAAAVAVALVQAADTARTQPTGRTVAGESWTAHVRTKQLARREHHDLRRTRR